MADVRGVLSQVVPRQNGTEKQKLHISYWVWVLSHVFVNFTLPWDTVTSQLPPLHLCTVIKICLARKTTAIKQMHLPTCFINRHIKDSHTACSQLPFYHNVCAFVTTAYHKIPPAYIQAYSNSMCICMIYWDHIKYEWISCIVLDDFWHLFQTISAYF